MWIKRHFLSSKYWFSVSCSCQFHTIWKCGLQTGNRGPSVVHDSHRLTLDSVLKQYVQSLGKSLPWKPVKVLPCGNDQSAATWWYYSCSLFWPSNRFTERILFGQDYWDKFNPQDYLRMYYSASNLSPIHLFKLKQAHEFYQSYPSSAKLKILDVGSGPSIASAISAAPYAAEIVLSEYTEANSSALLQWLNNDPGTFDCTRIFKHIVVDLEGKTEEEIPIRAELVRKVVKSVVPCDAIWDPPIPTEYVDQYDVVTDFFLPCKCMCHNRRLYSCIVHAACSP